MIVRMCCSFWIIAAITAITLNIGEPMWRWVASFLVDQWHVGKSKVRMNETLCAGRGSQAPRRASRSYCYNCNAKRTPQWRHGPHGERTLCNACGLKFRKGALARCEYYAVHVLGLPPAPVDPAPTAPNSPRLDIEPAPVEQVSAGEDGLLQCQLEMPQLSCGPSGGPVHSNNSALGMAREASVEDGVEDDASFGVAEIASQQRIANESAVAALSTRPALDVDGVTLSGTGREESAEPSTCKPVMADEREEVFAACGATVTVVAPLCNGEGVGPLLGCEEAAPSCREARGHEYVDCRPSDEIFEKRLAECGGNINLPLSCNGHLREGTVPSQDLTEVQGDSIGMSLPSHMLAAGLLPTTCATLSDGLPATANLEDTACR